MRSDKIDDCRNKPSTYSHYPALTALGLDETDFDAIRTQGFVSEERRGKRVYYKLRYRKDRKQKVKYIGNAERAVAIKNELVLLQAESLQAREISKIAKTASLMLRNAKSILKPLIESNGFFFHGLSIRRRRVQAETVSGSKNISS